MTKLHDRLKINPYWKLLCLSIFLYTGIEAQNPSRNYISHQHQNNQLEVKTNEGILTLIPYTSGIIEVSFEKTNFQNPDSSHAVILSAQKVVTTLKTNTDKLFFSTPDLTVEIRKSPFRLIYYYKDKYLTREEKGFFVNDSLQGFRFHLEPREHLYGTGERSLPLDRRGHRLELYNKAHYGYETYAPLMNYNIPLVLSSRKYILYFDNAPRGFIDLGKTQKDVLSLESTGGRMTYYLIAGDDFYELLDLYTDLTGKQPLPPRWALGNFASRYGYRTEQQAREVIEAYKKQKFPVDALVLDHYWYGRGEVKKSVGMGDLDWYKPAWPTAEKMLRDFKKKGIHTVLITQPFVLTNSKNYAETSQNRWLGRDSTGKTMVIPYFYFGETGLLDIFKPEAGQWFWQRYKKHIEKGVAGWWGDLGEPEVHPSAMQHSAGSADEVHNIYGHYWAKLLYENYRKEYPNTRPFILMRAGFAGSQRFGLIPWSGDVSRSWGGLQAQPSLALTMGLCGLAYMHSDLGGFAGGQKSPELYTRWLQYGVFQPIYRPHSQESVPSEPIYYSGKTKKIAHKFIRLRYALMLYNYTTMFQNMHRGTPLMRPLFFEEPDNPALMNLSDTYLWGDHFLVAPVTDPAPQVRKVYLPKGSQWVDFWNDTYYEGGQWIEINTRPETIPVFVRAGAFIPMLPPFSNTGVYSSRKITLHYYWEKNAEKSRGLMYEDDGKTPQAYTKNQYELWKFEALSKDYGQELRFSGTGGGYKGMPQKRALTLKLHGLATKPPKVLFKGKTLRGSWDKSRKIYTVDLLWKQKDAPLCIQVYQ